MLTTGKHAVDERVACSRRNRLQLAEEMHFCYETHAERQKSSPILLARERPAVCARDTATARNSGACRVTCALCTAGGQHAGAQ